MTAPEVVTLAGVKIAEVATVHDDAVGPLIRVTHTLAGGNGWGAPGLSPEATVVLGAALIRAGLDAGALDWSRRGSEDIG